ncbi:MAG: T9SS type A sorting domain-containing protein [Bacteroidota bacterium]|nr:T9SS type A sorting domain-containing protein [Bacteroidota bacterium]MDP4232291.1 T9SS type A sorting domain-containing protein [Bacteroidota bacterium]MDP4241430.1 T9SS type A sorting domain-containing protein [Bacteroidota bacterium]MDP4286746.1 T9SS type A sorting domain-containing protein [Bacteroidota bacterium]
MLSKQLVTLSVFAALVCAPASVLHAQWKQCTGPEGGSILTLASMGPYTFAGASGGTVYRSSDNGASWSQVLGTTNTDVKGIAISGSTIFVASDSLYISYDSGLTWTARAYFADYSRKAGFLAVLGRYLFYASPDGVFRTSDQGTSWESMLHVLSQCLMIKDGDLYVGSGISPGLSRSGDSGTTWSDIAIVDSFNDRVQSLAFEGNNIFAGSSWDDKIYRSTDNGMTWDTISIGLPQIGNDGSYNVITSLYQDSATLLAGTVFGLYRSLDTGTSWTKISSMRVQSFIMAGGYLLAGTATDGVVRSTDHGLHWASSITGLRALQITSFASIGKHLFVGVDRKGIYRSDDNGATFIPANKGIDSLHVDQIVTIDTMLFAFTNKLFMSSNFGDSWDSTSVSAYAPAAAIGSSLIATNNGTFVLSSDRGASWTKRSVTGPIDCLVSNGADLLACFGNSDCDHYVSSSSDSGLTWTVVFYTNCIYAYSVASDGDYLFAGTGPGYGSGGQGIFRKKRADKNWMYPSSFPEVLLGSYAINSITSSNSDIFISTDEGINHLEQKGIGVFHSSDFGDTWSAFNEGLTALVVPQLFLFPPYIFAGTQSSGVWRRPLSDFGINAAVHRSSGVASQEVSAYPNPFSQSTTISFTPEAGGHADVSIVNLLGVEVARIFSGELAAGEHTFTWDAIGLPAGTYECLIRMNGRVEMVPVIRLR